MPAKTMEEIALLLSSVRFKRRLVGGVDEDDVWRIMEKLQKEYAAVLEAQQARMNALLDERDRYIAYLESTPAEPPQDQPGGAAYGQ